MPDLPLVLVIEDEYLAQGDVEAALANGGFSSEIVFTAEEALTLFLGNNRVYAALVTDVRLGDGIDGWEVARRIRDKEPSLPIIYVTSSTEKEWASHGVPNSILVPKPFAAAQLVTALSNLLNIGSAPKG